MDLASVFVKTTVDRRRNGPRRLQLSTGCSLALLDSGRCGALPGVAEIDRTLAPNISEPLSTTTPTTITAIVPVEYEKLAKPQDRLL